MSVRTRNLFAVLTAAALAALMLPAMLPASASAQVSLASPLRAVFLKEYSKTSYTMTQGQILAFENDDPFLNHGVASVFSAPTIPPASTSLVRRAPFLAPGAYSFRCPVHPEMVSTLTVAQGGVPRPPDTGRPKASLKIVSSGKQLVNGGRVKVRAVPNEPVDIMITASVGRRRLGTATRAFPAGTGGAVKLAFDPAIAAGLGGTFTLAVKARITDAAGNSVKAAKTRRLSGPRK